MKNQNVVCEKTKITILQIHGGGEIPPYTPPQMTPLLIMNTLLLVTSAFPHCVHQCMLE